MRRIAIVNQKGGCGKTTTGINLAGVFARTGRRTLLVDMDPQSHCAAGLAIPEGRIDLHIGDAMLAAGGAPVDPARLLWRVSRNLDLAPSSMRLATLESARGGLNGKPHPEQCLSEALAPLDDQYDLCLIDCSPAIGLLTFNALCAADQIVIPVETGFFSLQGASKQVSTIKSLAKRLGMAPNYRLLPTMHDPESALARDLLEELRRRFPGRVAPLVIRFDQRLREAASFGQPVIEYAPESTGAADYRALADWLLERDESAGREEARSASPVTVVPGVGDRLAPLAQTGIEPAAAPGGRAADIAARARRMQATGQVVTSAADDDAEDSTPESEGPESQVTMEATTARQPEAPQDDAPCHRPMVYGARGGPGGVTFAQPASLGKSVCVAGEFNGWSAESHPMRLNEALGAFELRLSADAGLLQYRLVVDGRWMTDPYNPLVAPNSLGGANSVVVVPAQAVRPVAGASA